MKYVLLIHSNPTRWAHPMFLHQDVVLTDEERDRHLKQLSDLLEEITASGELVDSGALAAPTNTRTVRMRDAEMLVSDGPFADTKEHLAGFFVVDCESLERAVELATRFPDTRYGAIEVRPIMDLSGIEM